MTDRVALDAAALDAADPLAPLRDEFELPDGIYLVGNSLGALPRAARDNITTEFDRWSTLGVEGHFTGDLAWEAYHELLTAPLASLVGGREHEVVAMNSLTVNLHLLMVSFYRPTPTRHKVLIEGHAFPSDHFAVESQIQQRGLDPATSLVVLDPRPGEVTLRPDDILATIAEHGDSLALILLPGVQYYTGQVLPMAEITRAGHEVGATVGFDLAHAVGNVELDLHHWGVDFAAWCTYKYLNGGPGAPAFIYVKPLLQMEFFDRRLAETLGDRVKNLTPTNPEERGCQSALRIVAGEGRAVYERLMERRVLCDWREPDVIRVAPVPLYNSFEDIERFVGILDEVTR